MKIVHLADLHLGFRQYQRQTPTGINQREADVAASFKRAIDKTIELAPDIVLIAGDIFHQVRPTNAAILHAFTQFARLTNALPHSAIVMVAGNHDIPRTAETWCILRLFAPLGIHVVDTEARRIELPDRGVSILAVPDVPDGRPALTPDPNARYNVLLLHGEVEGVLPDYMRYTDRAAVGITPQELSAGRWDYVALGHYHVYRQVGPNAYYSGSIDYTSANSWGERREERAAGIDAGERGGKGIIEHNLVTHEHRFHQLPISRPWIDLPAIDATGMSAEDLNVAIAERVTHCPGGIDDKIVRLIVRDVPRHIVHDLDHKPLREYKRRTLHFHLDARKPELVRRSAGGGPIRRPSLAETVRDKLSTRTLDPTLNREEFVALGLKYLREADTLAAATPILGAADQGGTGQVAE